jgi:hypothetical protein
MEKGFTKLLGIILIGQPELKLKLDARSNFEAREFINRCEVFELSPLGTDLEGTSNSSSSAWASRSAGVREGCLRRDSREAHAAAARRSARASSTPVREQRGHQGDEPVRARRRAQGERRVIEKL